VPFFFLRIDKAGNVTKRFNATTFHLAQYGGACPRWDIHISFRTPGRIIPQFVEMPDGSRYFTVNRTVDRPVLGRMSQNNRLAVTLGCSIEHASKIALRFLFRLNHRLDRRRRLGDLLRGDVEVGDGAHETLAHRTDAHALIGEALGDMGRGEAGSADVEEDDVGLDRLGLNRDARHIRKAVGEQACVGVVLGQALDVVLQRIDAGRRDDAGLAHGAAEALLPVLGPVWQAQFDIYSLRDLSSLIYIFHPHFNSGNRTCHA